MTELVVRKLLIDLQARPRGTGTAAIRSTAFFNALSMSFPVGEQLFIDSMRLGLARLPRTSGPASNPRSEAFIGQEAASPAARAVQRPPSSRGWRTAGSTVARRGRSGWRASIRGPGWRVTAATEHFTAIMAEDPLTRPESLAGTEPRLMTMWLWHASEESEHAAAPSICSVR